MTTSSTADIRHRVGIRATPQAVFTALTSADELPRWWSEGAEGVAAVGERLRIRFGAFVQPMRVTALETSELVRYAFAEDGAPFWAGTALEFRLERDEAHSQTLVHFSHSGWPNTAGMFAKSSTHWAHYLFSLKSLLEEGAGRPFPSLLPDYD